MVITVESARRRSKLQNMTEKKRSSHQHRTSHVCSSCSFWSQLKAINIADRGQYTILERQSTMKICEKMTARACSIFAGFALSVYWCVFSMNTKTHWPYHCLVHTQLSGTSSSNGSNDDGSTADGTATSDEDFTDYLSTESEAELQREAEARAELQRKAEARAALLAQNEAEELEFKTARWQLAHVELHPPKSWDPKIIRYN